MREIMQDWLSVLGPNPYLQAAAIIAISAAAAKVVDWSISAVVLRWARSTKSRFDDRLVAILHRPVFVSVLLIGLFLATTRIAMHAYVEWFTLAVLKSLAIFVWLVFSFRFVRLFLEYTSARAGKGELLHPRLLPVIDNVANVILIGGAIYFAFLAWNVDVTAWLASAGIIGIALSFAAKDTLANLFAGAFILADAPYKVGDYVNLDTGERGMVTQIGLRSTRLLTRDDIEIIIPNAVMGNTRIINESGGPYEKERLRVQVGVAYGSDLDQVRQALIDVALSHPEVVQDPAPRVRFRAFGAHSLDHELLCWIEEPVLRGRVQDALNVEIYKRFTREKIEIPFPKRDLYIKQVPENGRLSAS